MDSSPSAPIALVTGTHMPVADHESHWLTAALDARGARWEVLPWQSNTDWSRFGLVLVRTPWDYFEHREVFLDWANAVNGQTRLCNPAPVLAWNSHKAYLRQLAEAGIPVIPTHWQAQGPLTGEQAAAVLAATGWARVVIKPAVSVGAIGACLLPASTPQAAEHLCTLAATGDVMVQPYVESIADAGELSLIYFGGRYSHAICKRPAQGDFRVQESWGGRVDDESADPAALALAERALRLAPGELTYARVDLVRYQGHWTVIELELIEPELFLGRHPAISTRFADCLVAALG